MNDSIPLQYEPMRQNRFLVEFPADFDIPSWIIKKINKPKLEVFGPNQFKWEPVVVKFHDLVDGKLSSKLIKVLDKEFETNIKMLDPVGTVVEKWIIIGTGVSIDFGKLNYDSDELTEVTLTIKPRLIKID